MDSKPDPQPDPQPDAPGKVYAPYPLPDIHPDPKFSAIYTHDALGLEPDPEPDPSDPLAFDLHCDRVRDGYECRFYRNGKLVASLTLTAPLPFLATWPTSFDLHATNAFLTEWGRQLLPVRSFQDANPQSPTYNQPDTPPFATFRPNAPNAGTLPISSPVTGGARTIDLGGSVEYGTGTISTTSAGSTGPLGGPRWSITHSHSHDHARDGYTQSHSHRHTHAADSPSAWDSHGPDADHSDHEHYPYGADAP